MFALALLTTLLNPAHALAPSSRLSTVEVLVAADTSDEVPAYDLPADEPDCEAEEIEVGSLGADDSDCELVTYFGFTEDCEPYTRTDFICVFVSFEEIEE